MDITKLPLLATLEVLLRERSVRETARLLGVSPSTVSRHLAQLRELVGDPLFVRSGNLMLPTDRARDLSVQLTPRLRELGRLLVTTPVFEPASASVQFVVAVSDAVMSTFVPPLLESVAAAAPGVTLHFVPTSGPPEGLSQALTTGAVDLYLGPPIGASEGVMRKKLFDAGFACIARRGNPRWADDAPLDLDTFCGLRHVLVSSRFPPKSWVDEALEQLGRARRVALTTPYFLGAAHIVASTDLVATLPDRPAWSVAVALGLRVAPVPLALPSIPFVMQWHERHRGSPEHVWLRQIVDAAVNQSGAEPSA